MDIFGYAGKILCVNLTTGDIKEELLDMELARKFVGGFGLNVKYAYDLIKPATDPLSAENAIIIGAGALVGTSAPASPRTSLTTKLPLTDTFGQNNCGMGFGSNLKYAGYDLLIITGKAAEPVYLRIFDDDVELCDAGELWGKDIFETTDRLWEKHETIYSVVAIGQAGENLVRMSLTLVDKSSSLGQFGLGAVMGSKNLKAIVAAGSRGIKIYNRQKFNELSKQLFDAIKRWPETKKIMELGHVMHDFEPFYKITPETGYFKEMLEYDDVRRRFGPEVYLSRWKKKRASCPSCPIGCRDVLEGKKGKYKGLRSFGAGIIPHLGMQLKLADLDESVALKDLLQRYGISEFDFQAIVQFGRELYERGILTKEDTGGIEFAGGFETNRDLLEKIAFRRGIGDVLADGLPGIVRRFGKECQKFGLFVKGAPDVGDPRVTSLNVMIFERYVAPMGPGTGKGGMLNPGKFSSSSSIDDFREAGMRQLAIPRESMDRITDTPYKINPGRLARHTEDAYAALSCLGVCIRLQIFRFYNMAKLAELYSAATGFDMTASELKKAGERAYNMLKVLNVREGFYRKDDVIPPRWFEPLKGKMGGENVELRMMDYFKTKVLVPADFEKFLDDFYDERGWDVEKGIPSKKKLVELGLADVAADLEKIGKLTERD